MQPASYTATIYLTITQTPGHRRTYFAAESFRMDGPGGIYNRLITSELGQLQQPHQLHLAFKDLGLGQTPIEAVDEM